MSVEASHFQDYEYSQVMHTWRGAMNTLRGKVATLAITAAAALGANAVAAPSYAEADCVTTTHTVQTPDGTTTTTHTVCGPDVTSTGQSPAPTPPVQPPHHTQPPAQPTYPHHPHHHHRPPKHHPHNPTGGVGVYQNPFRAEMRNGSLKPYRIDEGVDYRGHGKVYAIGPGILRVATNNSSFFANEGGQNTVYTLTAGKAKGRSVFVGEACKPRPGLIGHRVTAHTVICHMHADNFPGIETGWWNLHTDTPMAYPDYTPAGNPDGSKTAYGVNFSELLKSLGAPGGNTVHQGDRMSTNPGRTVGHLPHNWPRW